MRELSQKQDRKLEKLKEEAFDLVKKGSSSFTEGNAASSQSVHPQAESTPSRQETRIPLDPPIASPVTPSGVLFAIVVADSPDNMRAATSSRVADSASHAVGTPLRQSSRAAPKTPCEGARKVTPNPQSKPPSNASYNETARALEATKAASTSEPASRDRRSSVPDVPCKEPPRPLSRTSSAGAPEPKTKRDSVPSAQKDITAPPRTPSASSPKPVSNSAGTPHKDLDRSVRKEMASHPQPAPKTSGSSRPSSSSELPASSLTKTLAPSTHSSIPRVPPKTPRKTSSRVQSPASIKTEDDSPRRTILLSTPAESERRMASTASRTEKRKSVSGPSGFSPMARADIYDVPDDDEVDRAQSGKRPAKRPRKSLLPLATATSPRSDENNLGFSRRESTNGSFRSPIGRQNANAQAAAQLSKFSLSPADQLRHQLSPTLFRQQAPPSPTPMSRRRPGVFQSRAARSSLTSPSQVQPRLLTHTVSSPTTTSLSVVSQPQAAPPDHGDNFNIDRACYPGTGGQLHSFLSREDSRVHQLRLENGMYRPYLDNVIGDKSYIAWMINPKRIRRVEFCSEQRLVKITKSNGDNMSDTYILFGIIRMADFVDSIRKGWPDITVVKFDE